MASERTPYEVYVTLNPNSCLRLGKQKKKPQKRSSSVDCGEVVEEIT